MIFRHLARLLFTCAEVEAVHDQAGQQVGIAGRFDPHLAEHAGDDDLDVLVVDIDALAAIDALDFVHQVLLQGLFAGDPQDVVRHERAIDQGLAGLDVVARVDEEPLAVRHQMLALDAAFAADDDRPLAAALFLEDFDHAVDFGHHGRILRLASLEDFRHPRQTAGDVGDAGRFAGRLAEHRAGRDDLAFIDHDVGPFRQVVHVERLAFGVFQHDLRMQFALVIHDQPADVAAGVLLDAQRFAFDHVLVADLARDFGQESECCADPIRRAPGRP